MGSGGLFVFWCSGVSYVCSVWRAHYYAFKIWWQ
nr:MAG TPA_asm: hypothetical protein [Caudoviricetes sp.]